LGEFEKSKMIAEQKLTPRQGTNKGLFSQIKRYLK